MLNITVAQLNYFVGDIEGNTRKMIDAARRAALDGAELVVFSELSLTGYYPGDLLDEPLDESSAEDLAELLKALAYCKKEKAVLVVAKLDRLVPHELGREGTTTLRHRAEIRSVPLDLAARHFVVKALLIGERWRAEARPGGAVRLHAKFSAPLPTPGNVVALMPEGRHCPAIERRGW